MPRGDGTGPSGQGPRTGRGLGKCGRKSGQNQNQGTGQKVIPNEQNPVGTGRGQGGGQGGGQGRGRN